MANKRIKRRIEKKRAAIQHRRAYGNSRSADIVYTYGIYRLRKDSRPHECFGVAVFTARPVVRDAIRTLCIDAIHTREKIRLGYGESVAAWDARCRKYKESRT